MEKRRTKKSDQALYLLRANNVLIKCFPDVVNVPP